MTLPLRDIALGAGVPIEHIEHGYRAQGGTPGLIPGLYPLPEQLRRRSEELKESDPRLTLGLIRRALKLGSFYTEEDTQQLHNEIYGTDALQQFHEDKVGPETPQVFDYEALAPTSREINTDGRSYSTAFDEHEREKEQDPISYPIPDQVVGPTKYTAQKGASELLIPKVGFVSDNRNPESTPNYVGIDTQSPATNQDSSSDRGGNEDWSGFDRESQLNEGKTMPSSFKTTQLPEAKFGYDISGISHALRSLQGNQRSVIKSAAAGTAKTKNEYRRRVDIYIHDGKGNILAAKTPQGGYRFPGGGVDPGESINAAAKRETLEEVGWETTRPRAVPGIRVKKQPWTDKQRETSGRDFKGDKTYHRFAEATKRNTNRYGEEGDTLAAGFVPITDVVKALEHSGKQDHDFAKYHRINAKALTKITKSLEAGNKIDKAAAAVLRRKSASEAGEANFTAKDRLNAASRVASPNRRGTQYPAAEEGREAENNYRSLDQIWREADAPDVHPMHSYEFGGSV